MIRVLFVCKGNICRSPMAEAIFKQMVRDAGLTNDIFADSAGVKDWHIGKAPHPGTIEVLQKHNIPYNGIMGRQIRTEDLQQFDYIVAMDEQNLEALKHLGSSKHHMFRLLDPVASLSDKNVPDPFYDGQFDRVYELLEVGCRELLVKIKVDHDL